MNFQQTLESESDDQLNYRVSLAIHKHSIVVDTQHGRRLSTHGFVDRYRLPKYCKDPSIIMPIALDNRIGFDWSHTTPFGVLYWMARGITQRISGPFVRFQSISADTPYRAMVIVFLLIKEGEK